MANVRLFLHMIRTLNLIFGLLAQVASRPSVQTHPYFIAQHVVPVPLSSLLYCKAILLLFIISLLYKMYRLDRNDGYGGIFISVKSNFSSQLIQYGESCELCAVKLRLTGCASMIIIGAYRPPNRDITYMQYLCDTITDISIRCPHSFICCAGDFNVPDISWATESVSSYRYPLLIN